METKSAEYLAGRLAGIKSEKCAWSSVIALACASQWGAPASEEAARKALAELDRLEEKLTAQIALNVPSHQQILDTLTLALPYLEWCALNANSVSQIAAVVSAVRAVLSKNNEV